MQSDDLPDNNWSLLQLSDCVTGRRGGAGPGGAGPGGAGRGGAGPGPS